MGGMVSKLNNENKEEVVGDLETEGRHMHPFLIPQVARTIFSSLGRNDLLTARRVCREWHFLGTETYKNRKDILHYIYLYDDQVTFQQFIDVMALSTRIPVVRWDIHIQPLSIPPAVFFQFISFIAPSVKSLGIGFFPQFTVDQNMRMNALGELLYKLNTLDPTHLMMPELEVLDVWRCSREGDPAYHQAVTRVTHRIVAGAGALRSFRVSLPVEETILDSLPRRLERLDFAGVSEDNPYAGLRTSGFQLTALRDKRMDPYGLFEFLCLQKMSLSRLSVQVEDVDGQFCRLHSSPQLKMVTKLECDVNCNSTFRFLCRFPNLVELAVFAWPLRPPTASKMVEIADNLSSLSQHPSVRKLHISFCTWEDEPELHQLIVFDVFGHCFPNLTHLSITMANSAIWMRDVFAQFQNLESLYLDVFYEESPPREWETLLSGIPAPVCDAMREAENYEDFVFGGDESRFGTGLANLKRLQTLEVRDEKHRFEFLFTPLIFHRVFSRMASLKQICFVQEDRIPEACLPFVEPLRARGVDLYRMKREIEIEWAFNLT